MKQGHLSVYKRSIPDRQVALALVTDWSIYRGFIHVKRNILWLSNLCYVFRESYEEDSNTHKETLSINNISHHIIAKYQLRDR